MPIDRNTFLKQYLKALEEGTAAIFAGAGLSMPSGFVDWKTLLADIVKDLKLDPDTENLVSAAQFHFNERRTRGALNQILIEEFTKDAEPNHNHQLIARLPIETVWTTNYDTLIEDAMKTEYKRADVKHRQEQLAVSKPGRHVTIYKMHGDISSPDEAVLLKEDYERYESKRKLFAYQLQGDLVSKTFLFVGFSFTDPNIDYLLSRIRGLMGENTRPHYCVMRVVSKPKEKDGTESTDPKRLASYAYDRRRQELLIGDLKRYGIQTVLIQEYSEITEILERLSALVHRKSVFVSGSAQDYSPLGQARIEALCRTLGSEIVTRDYNLTSGFGLGIGGWVILGAMEALYRKRGGRVDERLTLRPFPQNPTEGSMLPTMWKRYREEMIGKAGSTIFVCGNKLDQGGNLVSANGCIEEFEITKALGRTPIPIGCTGHAAADIWKEVDQNVEAYYPGKASEASPELAVLNDNTATNEEIISAVFKLLKLVGTSS